MNKVILMGRLTRDPDVRYSPGEQAMAIARYTLAVDRRFAKKEEGQVTADFISCVAFGKAAEFAEKYFHTGQRVLIEGRITTSRYEKDGQTQYRTDVVIESQEFADSKQSNQGSSKEEDSVMDGFMNIPDSLDDEDMPFN